MPKAELVKRSSSSLTFKVTPAAEDTTGLFYTLKHNGNSFPSPSDHIEVPNLPAYSNETVEVYACYSPTFCSEASTVTAQTNVGGGLTIDFQFRNRANIEILGREVSQDQDHS